MPESCPRCERVMSHTRLSHITHMRTWIVCSIRSVWAHTCEMRVWYEKDMHARVMSRTWLSRITLCVLCVLQCVAVCCSVSVRCAWDTGMIRVRYHLQCVRYTYEWRRLYVTGLSHIWGYAVCCCVWVRYEWDTNAIRVRYEWDTIYTVNDTHTNDAGCMSRACHAYAGMQWFGVFVRYEWDTSEIPVWYDLL